MIIVRSPAIIARSAWFIWALLVTLALMFISGSIGVVLIVGLDRWLPRTPALAGGLVGALVGATVGGFHSVWANRESARASLSCWVSMSALLGMSGMVIFTSITAMVFDLNQRIMLGSALRFGLLYGAACSSLIVVFEWLVLRQRVSSLWTWLCVEWTTWLLWWIGLAYLLSEISGMD